jgi:hypothetical protein
MEAARFRLGLRQPAAEAATALGGAGLVITENGAGWQVSLGAGG